MSQIIQGESIIAKSMDIEDIKSIMNWSYTNLCSDGSPNGHPRGWGSFPKYLNILYFLNKSIILSCKNFADFS